MENMEKNFVVSSGDDGNFVMDLLDDDEQGWERIGINPDAVETVEDLPF